MRKPKETPHPNLCKECGKVAKYEITIPRKLLGYYCKPCKEYLLEGEI